MKPSEIESWALRIIDQVKNGRRVEDTRVELKSQWPEDVAKTARQLGGHANVSGGEPILWLIGLDERTGVVGVAAEDIATWYPRIQAQFDGVSPRLTELNVPTDSKTIMALIFETERRPYVVKNPAFGQKDGGPVALEVPWRENTSVRSARREDLIRLLEPFHRLPDIDVMNAELVVQKWRQTSNDVGEDQYNWRLTIDTYLVPKQNETIVVPFYRCSCVAETSAVEFKRVSLTDLRLAPPYLVGVGPDSLTVATTNNEIIVHGPGKVRLTAKADMIASDLPYPFPPSTIHIDSTLFVDLSTTSFSIQAELQLTGFDPSKGAEQEFRWQMQRKT